METVNKLLHVAKGHCRCNSVEDFNRGNLSWITWVGWPIVITGILISKARKYET
jgi:hypothetical protein